MGSETMREARFFPHAGPVLLAAASLMGAGPGALASDARVIGIVERVADDRIVVDSATVVLTPDGRIRGDVDALSKAKVGYWAEADGSFTEQGLFRADDVKIREDAPGASFADHVTKISLKEAGKLDASDHIFRDPAVNDYVRKVGSGLVPEYAAKEHEFSFEVIRDPTLNAFALPSGAIYVHTGLLARLDNEAQLGIVLGHEISHVTQRHGQRQYKAGVTAMIPAQIGAIVLGVQFQRRNDNPFQQFMVGLGLNMGLAASVNGYGRTLEDQADRVGLRYAVETGYDPAEGPKIWDTFNDVDGDEGKVENFFYGNHSTNAVRKENLSEEIDRHYESPGVPDLAGDGEAPPQAAPKTRLVNEEVYQQTMLDLTRENAVEDFDLERYHLASKGFDRVLRHRPGDPVAHHYAGRILLATDESPEAPGRALQEYLKAVSMAPDYPDVHRDLGLLYARMGRNPDAAAHFRRYLELAPETAKDRREVEKELRKAEGT
jgi:beta-barrel assembly-enhancing protease